MTSNQRLNFVRLNFCLVPILIGFLFLLGFQQFNVYFSVHAQSVSDRVTNDNVVILNFDDGRKTQFTEAKPILDKYEKLIISLRTAQAKEYSLDKEQTSYDDLLDLFCNFSYRTGLLSGTRGQINYLTM